MLQASTIQQPEARRNYVGPSAARLSSALPEDARAIIERERRSVTQSGPARSRGWRLRFDRRARHGVDPLTGWTTGADPLAHLTLRFPDLASAIRYAERSLAMRREMGDVWGQGQSLHFFGVALYGASRYRECIERCEEAVRLLERRPVTQGGTDHTSHRLVYYGLSEGRAVALLALIAIAVGATGIAYNVLDNGRVTVVGVLVTMVLLVQFASFLSDLEQRARRGAEDAAPSLLRALLEPRRLAEILVDFVLICVAFLAAYVLLVDGRGSPEQRDVFLAALPVVIAARYLCFVVAGVYRRVWRFAGARDTLVIAAACAVASLVALVVVETTRGLASFPWEIFALDALLATVLVAGSRVALGLALEARDHLRSDERRRVLVVGAGRAGRRLARELRETPGTRVVGFVDDNPGVRRRRIAGVTVAGGLDEIEGIVASAQPDEVLVTIAAAPAARLALVARACREADVPCRFLKRTESRPALEALVE